MGIIEVGNLTTSKKEFINEIELIGNFEGIENFFVTEEKLLHHLFNQEKNEAQQLLQNMIDYVSKSVGSNPFYGIKCYLITLSSLVARRLEKNIFTPPKAVAFNFTCIMLIEQKLNEQNALIVGDELIEFFMYVLAERKRPSLMHNTVNNVIQFINDKVDAVMTVEEIAKKFNVSTSHLSRIFREHTGTTLVEYINIRKVEESQYYLRFSEKKISDISSQFNFCNQSYFTRIFKKYTGETPEDFEVT